jgi:hypothetical protein
MKEDQGLSPNSNFSEAQMNFFFEAECARKEELMQKFEELERKERRRKKINRADFVRKYERVTKGLFSVQRIGGDFVHLIDENQKKLGVLHVTPEVSKLLQVNDCLYGTFGFRDGYWRVQFLFGISSSAEDFVF